MLILPGPLAPPDKRRPSRNMTALSYSCTTCKEIKKVTHILRFY